MDCMPPNPPQSTTCGALAASGEEVASNAPSACYPSALLLLLLLLLQMSPLSLTNGQAAAHCASRSGSQRLGCLLLPSLDFQVLSLPARI